MATKKPDTAPEETPQDLEQGVTAQPPRKEIDNAKKEALKVAMERIQKTYGLSLIHISEPTRPY